MQAGLDPPILENELIQWIKAHQHQAFQRLEEIEADALAHGLKFRNTPYPLFPRFLILSAKFRSAVEFLSERLLAILEKLIHIWGSPQITDSGAREHLLDHHEV